MVRSLSKAKRGDGEIETDQQLFEQQQGEIEDLLGAALNLSIQQCYLDVHYRSRNADLIEALRTSARHPLIVEIGESPDDVASA